MAVKVCTEAEIGSAAAGEWANLFSCNGGKQPLAKEKGEQMEQKMSQTNIVFYCCVQKWITQPLSQFPFTKWGESAGYIQMDRSN